ncbi:hypothetical protein SAMN05444169_2948 [Bradyrhizobium erythrophlei]|uniref:Uncharacterized protein n=1 Tax=Bradyrhizobium erythrophlei TaxID=1437360 RepID=A0A1M5KMB2_9BRAD|nr:hypothetical protein SAMN05444169_2948 [Bradyrhizobium erythrophlei]
MENSSGEDSHRLNYGRLSGPASIPHNPETASTCSGLLFRKLGVHANHHGRMPVPAGHILSLRAGRSRQFGQGPLWVKIGRTRIEQMSSAVLPTTDIRRCMIGGERYRFRTRYPANARANGEPAGLLFHCLTSRIKSSLWDSNVRTCDTNNGLLTRIACMLPPPIRAIGPHEEPWYSSDRNSPATGAWRTSPPLHSLESTRLCASTQQTYGSKPRSEDIYARVVPGSSTLSEGKATVA